MDWCTRGTSFATSFLDLQVCQHGIACLQAWSILMPQLLQCPCQGARSRRRCTWRAGRRLSTPLAISGGSTLSPVCMGLLWPVQQYGCGWKVVACRSLSPLLRLASDVLWDQRGAEPREAKMSKLDLSRSQDPMSCPVAPQESNNQTHTNTIPHLSLPYHFRKESEKW